MTELRFDGQVAIVTGGGSGIGAASAKALAARGAKVVIVDLGCDTPGDGSDPERGRQIAAEIRAAGGEALALFADIGEPGVAEEAVDLALKEFGGVHILLGNAAIERTQKFYKYSWEEVHRHLDVNLLGSWALCKAAWPHLRAQNYGRVIFSASSSLLGAITGTPYAMSKGGLVSLNRSLAGYASAVNLDIKFNIISPYAHTRMWTHPQYGGTPETRAAQDELGRHVSAEGVAKTVVVLAHESCPPNGEIYSCANGKVEKIYFAVTEGVEDRDMTPESLLASWAEVENTDGAEELKGTSLDYATPFMARAWKVMAGES